MEKRQLLQDKKEAEYAAIKVKDLLLSLQPEVSTLQKLTAEVFNRPANDLPDWCKVGAWVYLCNGRYYKVESVNECHVNLSDGVSVGRNSIHSEMVSARLRPYNAEEIPDLPFEVTMKNSNYRTVVVSCQGNKVWLAGESRAISTEELMRHFTTKGKTCGILEHLEDGEWVK